MWKRGPSQEGQTRCNVLFSGVSIGAIKRLPVGIFGSRSRVKLEENYTHGCSRWIAREVPVKFQSLMT